MSFEDEKIVALRNAEMKKQYNTIETGIYVGDELIHFAQCSLFDGRMSIMLPNSFIDMDLEDARKKYPSENRPQIIKTNKDGTVNFTFNILEKSVTRSEISEQRDMLKSLIWRIQPANILYNENIIILDSTDLAYFDYKGYAIDDELYIMQFLSSIDGYLMMGTFNCIFDQFQKWKNLVLTVIKSVADLTLMEAEANA